MPRDTTTYEEQCMELFQPGEIVELKSTGPKMTITIVDNSSGEATCMWFEGKDRQEGSFDIARLRKVHQQKPKVHSFRLRPRTP